MKSSRSPDLQPLITVDFGGANIVGVYPTIATDQLTIASIPGAPQASTFDLLVQTRLGGQPGL